MARLVGGWLASADHSSINRYRKDGKNGEFRFFILPFHLLVE
ncbi:hypothetical protein [Limibacterium fermenti]